ncbi:phage baseplate assembly protein V [Microbacterium sp. B2969]|uniref:Phage baseplate assembly protein V n=1 Tax=Microbacterium alkaliflavum TaxID=3248839 RepID=A0ABW7Q1S0_9MICO
MSLHRGIVIDTADPAGSGRLRVEVPDVSTESMWAPTLIPLGVIDLQLPAVGTGVWVDFESDDFSSPVVLGLIAPTP